MSWPLDAPGSSCSSVCTWPTNLVPLPRYGLPSLARMRMGSTEASHSFRYGLCCSRPSAPRVSSSLLLHQLRLRMPATTIGQVVNLMVGALPKVRTTSPRVGTPSSSTMRCPCSCSGRSAMPPALQQKTVLPTSWCLEGHTFGLQGLTSDTGCQATRVLQVALTC